MSLVRLDPFQMMRWPNIWDDEDITPATSSNLDIYETANDIVVKASVPGISEDEIEVTFEKGVLWIRGEEKTEESKEKKYYRKATRSFSYKVAVPGNVDSAKEPHAEIEHGVITITFKKAEEAKPKKISVSRK